MDTFTVSGGEGRYRVDIAVAVCGKDLTLTICGGTHPHVGACALGVPRPSLRDENVRSASESVLCVLAHKDDEVAKAAAHQMAATFGCVTCISAGLHLDDASAEDIKGLMAGYQAALGAVMDALVQRGFGVNS